MRSPFRPSRPDRALRAAAALLLAAGLVACSSDREQATAHSHPVIDPASLGAPDRMIAGPQGRVPQFVVECSFSHSATDDPIVWYDRPGASHLHVFFGNTSTDATSTLESLEAGDTTCDQPLDRAAYWAPALLQDGEMLVPVKSTAYYRAGPDVEPTTVQPYPAGLKMLAGDPAAATPQPLSAVAWACGAGSQRWDAPPTCPLGRNARLVVIFPDCWDGVHTDSDDHRSHMAYSAGGRCPDTHPVSVPQLQFSVEYPLSGETTGLIELASGGSYSGHADFVNAWDADKLAHEVEVCLHRRVVCGVASGKTDG